MNYLLDTNAVSEPGRLRPDSGFVAWFSAVEEGELYVSAITVGEIRRGVSRLDPGPQRSRVEGEYLAVLAFGDRILPVDVPLARAWGDLSARLMRLGKPAGAADELIAATAVLHGLTLVTRNVKHFEPTGCRILSPWAT